MNHFYFLRPYLLLLIIPLIFLLVALYRRKLSHSYWLKFCDPELLPFILKTKSVNEMIPLSLLALGGVLSLIAMAGPSFEQMQLPVVKPNKGLVIALDLSPSMNSEDIKPTRLKRAIYKINDILGMQKEGYTALIVYTDEAFVVTPLTDDIKTIAALLPSLSTDIMPTHGLKHDSAIKKGQELLKNGNIDEGSILLITASDQTGQTADVSSTTPVHVLAMATKEGAPIPFKSDSRGDGAFQQDSKGNIIFSKLQKEPLAKLAKASGGKFTTITTDERDINHLLKDGASSNNYEKEEELTLNAPHDSGYWLVLAALPFFAILLRKRGFLTFLLIMQTPSFVIGNIWLTPDQQGKASFDQEQYQQAACEFQDPAWQAASHFKAANYKEALSLYEKDTTADGHYNRGNTLAKLGEIDKAIKAYEMALKEYPEHEDAAFNKQLLEKMKEQNQENQQEKQEKDQDDQDDSNDNTEENEDNSQNEEAEDDKNEESGQEDVDNKEEAPQEEEKGADKNEEINPMQQRDKNLLERVPDDPGALLRRKFLYQYKAKNGHL